MDERFLNNNLEYENLIEIIDLRTLSPWDKDLVYKKCKKTNKVMILTEDNITGSIASEISADLTQNMFEYLDAPIVRLGSLDTPIPFSSNIENIYMPISRIKENIEKNFRILNSIYFLNYRHKIKVKKYEIKCVRLFGYFRIFF